MNSRALLRATPLIITATSADATIIISFIWYIIMTHQDCKISVHKCFCWWIGGTKSDCRAYWSTGWWLLLLSFFYPRYFRSLKIYNLLLLSSSSFNSFTDEGLAQRLQMCLYLRGRDWDSSEWLAELYDGGPVSLEYKHQHSMKNR